MSTLSVSMADDDLDFLRDFAGKQGASAGNFLAQHARNLRLTLQAELHPDVVAASGAFEPAGIDPGQMFLEEMGRKHR